MAPAVQQSQRVVGESEVISWSIPAALQRSSQSTNRFRSGEADDPWSKVKRTSRAARVSISETLGPTHTNAREQDLSEPAPESPGSSAGKTALTMGPEASGIFAATPPSDLQTDSFGPLAPARSAP